LDSVAIRQYKIQLDISRFLVRNTVSPEQGATLDGNSAGVSLLPVSLGVAYAPLSFLENFLRTR